MKPRALPGCLCCPAVGFVCDLHRSDSAAYAKEEADGLSDEMPWSPDTLPDRLKGFGHRVADQDGGNGSEWIWPEEDHAEQMIEAARVLFEAEVIEERSA